MAPSQTVGMGRLMITFALFVVLGVPLVAYVWETVNRLLAGYFDGTRVLISIPAFALLLVVLNFLSRTLKRLEGERKE